MQRTLAVAKCCMGGFLLCCGMDEVLNHIVATGVLYVYGLDIIDLYHGYFCMLRCCHVAPVTTLR